MTGLGCCNVETRCTASDSQVCAGSAVQGLHLLALRLKGAMDSGEAATRRLSLRDGRRLTSMTDSRRCSVGGRRVTGANRRTTGQHAMRVSAAGLIERRASIQLLPAPAAAGGHARMLPGCLAAWLCRPRPAMRAWPHAVARRAALCSCMFCGLPMLRPLQLPPHLTYCPVPQRGSPRGRPRGPASTTRTSFQSCPLRWPKWAASWTASCAWSKRWRPRQLPRSRPPPRRPRQRRSAC